MIDVTSSEQWQWQEWQGKPYLTCELLRPWQHGFFTTHFAPQMPEEFAAVFDIKPNAYRVKQVHGNVVLSPTEISWEGEHFSQADGIITDGNEQAVFVASADCTPALIGDRLTGQVSAVHAGWRGTAKRILPTAIQKFLDAGSELNNLCVALGPAISGEVYQVSTDVALAMGTSLGFKDLEHDPEAMILALENIEQSPLLFDPEPDKLRLDVRRVNQIQLEQLGLAPTQVAIAPHCTFQEPDNFFSYRRSNEKKVQWSGITSRNP
ncbi:Multi-copper polyphenol oxidoreductase, laccase [[Leptolyngbya] sp. PCC 7376]|uniref:peptidoglycan editing factor PgeF n=1 Tax=[Leptolyngbya] sp. PCC 7376 TaxID=111781 RepID=UPI00029F0FB1|nr:peptidoglycan editing factor PgeF [[Leptolyngbya] sp. PCC 7376]AFY36764.1 Multi-copper polyphenol oxidoreductase, laccase [[Leptolyngbya] sp. PCC 7376]